ncbi:catalase-related immune-responsive family protein, partial [Vibrio parahaemolyticus V-223/04]
SKWFEQ